MRILVAEDDNTLATQIKETLSYEGRTVDVALDGEETQHMGATEPYDLVILDIGLPKIDGLSVLKNWRRDKIQIPVLILTARGNWSERVDGLDAGADDYMTKPFHMPELSARVRAMLRRSAVQYDSIYEKGDVVFETRTNKVLKGGVPVSLTAQEVAVLSYLFHCSGRMVSRTELSDHIYEFDKDRESNTIAVFINRLRKKLGKDLIISARGLGYQIKLD